MCDSALLLYCAFATRNTLKNPNPVLLLIECLHIDKVDGWSAMLSDQDRFTIFLNLRDESRGLTLESSHEFRFHRFHGDTIVILVVGVNGR